MAHRRAEGGTFSFDLEPDEDDEPFEDSPAEPSRLGRAAGALAARVRSWPRRRVVALAAVVGVAVTGTVGTMSLTSRARQRAWAQVAATAPGAVVDLGHEPVEAWRVPVASPTPLGLVGDVLVVQSGQWESSQGPTIYGVDLERGEIAWTTVPPASMDCAVGTPEVFQQSLAPRVVRGDAVICLSSGGSEVAVITGAARSSRSGRSPTRRPSRRGTT